LASPIAFSAHAGGIQPPVELLDRFGGDALVGPAKQPKRGRADRGGLIQQRPIAEIARHAGVKADHARQPQILRAA